MTHPPESTHALLSDYKQTAPPARRRADCFSVEPLLAGLSVVPEPGDIQAMEALVKRVTISRQLHAFYRPDFSGPGGDEHVEPPYSRVFCAGLLTIAATGRDWKFLNTAFCVLDGLLTEPPLDDADGRLLQEARRVLGSM